MNIPHLCAGARLRGGERIRCYTGLQSNQNVWVLPAISRDDNGLAIMISKSNNNHFKGHFDARPFGLEKCITLFKFGGCCSASSNISTILPF